MTPEPSNKTSYSESIKNYFLWFKVPDKFNHSAGDQTKKTLIALLQLASLYAGVTASFYIKEYLANPEDMQIFRPALVIALIISILLLPAAAKTDFKPNLSPVLHFATLFAMGFGWENIISIAGQFTT